MSEAYAETGAKVMSVPGPVYRRLTEIKNQRTAQKRRQVTYGEVLEELLDVWAEVNP